MFKNMLRPFGIALSTIALAASITSCADFLDEDYFAENPEATVDAENDYYRVTGAAQRNLQTTPGNTGYCEPDDLGRAVCAYGELTADTRAAARRNRSS